jgi:hypothetical protein
MLPFNRNLKPLARPLRKNMTDAELAVWSKLRRKQLNSRIFYRQKNIGNYILDFSVSARSLWSNLTADAIIQWRAGPKMKRGLPHMPNAAAIPAGGPESLPARSARPLRAHACAVKFNIL